MSILCICALVISVSSLFFLAHRANSLECRMRHLERENRAYEAYVRRLEGRRHAR